MNGQKQKFQTLLMVISLLWMDHALAAPLGLSYSVIAPTVAGVWMAQETGAFKKYDLDVELIYIPSSGTNIQALLGGSIDISTLPCSFGSSSPAQPNGPH